MQTLNNILHACAALSSEDRLATLATAWLVAAQEARDAALPVPGAFDDEQKRQLDQLAKMAMLVRSDPPDLERVRFQAERDWQGVIKHVRRVQANARGEPQG